MSNRARLAAAMLATVASFTVTSSFAAPVTYKLDPDHTYPSFEADHLGGLSTWRGKFNASSGTVVMDREAGTGTLEVRVDTDSIDFGHDKMNEHARSADIFDVARFPLATYTGKLAKFVDGAPTEVHGELTLKGVTKPLVLQIDRFVCKPHPMLKKDVCGADASAVFERDAFGVDYGKAYGFDMQTVLRIQVEAIRADAPSAM
ncbi:MAG: YceI family protein [Steroidobacteraceae bacterium]